MQQKHAVTALWVLTATNLLNYMDRFLVAALLPAISLQLRLSDRQAGLVGTAFMVSYFVLSPVFGYVGDRGHRPRWLAFGVACWSVATAAAAACNSLGSLLVARACVGIGEAAYGSMAPALLADSFPKEQRNRILGIFFIATPVGSALGYLLGGVLGERYGWRLACSVVGLPGALMALAAARLHDPPRGASDGAAWIAPPSLRSLAAALAHNRLYLGTVAGYCAYTFAIGGLAFWMPTYLVRVRGAAPASGMVLFGGVTVLTGICGTLLGSVLADRLRPHTNKAYTWVNATSMLGAAAAAAATLQAKSDASFIAWLAVAQLCMFLSTAPVNALILEAVSPAMRASASALGIFAIHLLGDALSPTLIGSLSDAHGMQTAMALIPAFYLLAGAIWGSTLWPKRR